MLQTLSRLIGIRPAPQTLAERYNRAADKWHDAMHKYGQMTAYADLVRQAEPKLPKPRNDKALAVLDAGAGTGAFSIAFRQIITQPMEVDLLDVSDAMLAAAKNNHMASGHTTNQICADIAALDPKDKRYDVILCAHSIEHCPDPVAALEKLRAVLTPGGIILLSVSKPHWCTAIVQFTWRHKAYRVEKFLKILSSANLTNVETYGFAAGPPKFLSYGYIVNKETS